MRSMSADRASVESGLVAISGGSDSDAPRNLGLSGSANARCSVVRSRVDCRSCRHARGTLAASAGVLLAAPAGLGLAPKDLGV